MSYSSTASMLPDLERTGQLLRFTEPIDARLEMAAVLRRVYAAGGPAVLFTRPLGSPFPVVGNLYGQIERARFLLRHGLRATEAVMKLRADPASLLRNGLPAALGLPHGLPIPVPSRWAPVLACRTSLDQLPRFVSWPDDGGPFVTLPQVYSEAPGGSGPLGGNLGMYRVQLAGNDYAHDEAGLHYQLHRGIGVHHAAALARGERLWVNVFVGGPPALTWAAVMPLPEGTPELAFAGLLGGRGVRLARSPSSPLRLSAEADFVIQGYVEPGLLKPEGPFGDHLGYYSLTHPYPVLKVTGVYHRRDAVWPATVVGRPPQEDTSFGALIHELTGPVLPAVLPGIKQVHAVDAAGVHPLLLAVASERYHPFQPRRRPQELLVCAHAILGHGQLSLAKFLWIAAQEDDPALDCHDVGAFLRHMLERVDWRRDLHFETQTTIDTLDYSGSGLNQGSKVTIAAVGEPIRKLPELIPESLPEGVRRPRVVMPGVLALEGVDPKKVAADHPLCAFPLWVVCDDSEFVAASLHNFLWVAFTRVNPAADIDGVEAGSVNKHWGCKGSLILNARSRPQHAPPLLESEAVTRKVEAWAARGGPLAGRI